MFLTCFKQSSVFVLGAHCLLCQRATHRLENICDSCEKNLPKIIHKCFNCSISIPIQRQLNDFCAACQASKPPFDRLLAAFPYEFPIIQLVKRLKFLHERPIARLFADHLYREITNNHQKNERPTLIIPIPLHIARYKERGFNQAEIIAKYLSRKLLIPLDTRSAERIKNTEPQAMLKAKRRQENMKNAFIAKRLFTGEYIAVVDDVVTTTETVRAFCTLLKQHGAGRIDVWCIARRC